jgi:predicted nuclease of predicted toxin-antitoxin system
MKFLADMGVSMTTVEVLRGLGHDIVHLREQDLIRMEDPDIIVKARREARVVLTFDLDFGEIMALTRTASPSVVLFRMRNQTPASVTPRLIQLVNERESQLAQGAFVTVEDNGYRLRRLPIHGESRTPPR